MTTLPFDPTLQDIDIDVCKWQSLTFASHIISHLEENMRIYNLSSFALRQSLLQSFSDFLLNDQHEFVKKDGAENQTNFQSIFGERLLALSLAVEEFSAKTRSYKSLVESYSNELRDFAYMCDNPQKLTSFFLNLALENLVINYLYDNAPTPKKSMPR